MVAGCHLQPSKEACSVLPAESQQEMTDGFAMAVRFKPQRAGHFGAQMHFAPGLGQFNLTLAFSQFFLLLGRALVVAMGAAQAFHVVLY